MKPNFSIIVTIQTVGKGVISAIGANMYLFGSASIRYACYSDSCSFRV